MGNRFIFCMALMLALLPAASNEAGSGRPRLPFFMTAKEPTSLLVYQCARFYGLKHPETVTAQAVLETGNYSSTVCRKNRNLFGLYDAKRKRYRTYKTWQESVVDYQKLVQSKYKSGNYYAFLRRLPYAEDPHYVDKVRRVQKGLKVTAR